MQIPSLSSLYGQAAASADPRSGLTADNGEAPAGFASLLLQTNQALQAPPAPVSTPTPTPQPVAPAPMPQPMAASPAEPANGASSAQDAKTANTDKPADSAATSGSANANTASNAAAHSAANDSSSVAAQTRRDAAARTAQRAKLRAADSAAAGNDANDAAVADKTPPGTVRDGSRKDAAAAPGSDASAGAAAMTNTAPPAAPPPATSPATTAQSGYGATGRGQIDLSDPQNARPGAAAAIRLADTGSAQKPDVHGVAGRPSAGTDAAVAASAASPASETLAPGVAFAALLAEQRTSGSDDKSARAAASVDAANPNPSALGVAVPSTGSTATVATAIDLPTAVNAPGFAQQLGIQVSVLAKDGIQHAELHLNPADMGPVSVQITMDGTQARVDFGAEVAATRHAIEAGLPALASALADAGFTLAGGGVSQHAGNGGRGDGSQGSSAQSGRRGTGGSTAPVDAAGRGAARSLRRTVSAGGVDLYA